MSYWSPDTQENITGQEKKKFLSKKQIVRALYRQGTLSGAEITALIHLSTPTTLLYINELVEEGYAELRGKGDSIGGRKPNLYGLQKNSSYILGMDWGLKQIHIALFNNAMEKLTQLELPLTPLQLHASVLDELHKATIRHLVAQKFDVSKIIGCGLIMPGLVQSETGYNHSYMKFEHAPLTQLLEDRFKIPFVLENDAKARTLAELKFGAARMTRNGLLILLDWGLGLGMIFNGKVYKGEQGFAGEFSHIPMDPEGILCQCGKIGCLETLASGRALVRYTHEALLLNSHSLLFADFEKDPGKITQERIIEAAQKGDALAIQQLLKIGQSLGKGISYLIQILNPGTVILGGSMASASDLLLNPMQQALYQHCLPRLRENVTIKWSTLHNDAGVMGAAAVWVERALAI